MLLESVAWDVQSRPRKPPLQWRALIWGGSGGDLGACMGRCSPPCRMLFLGNYKWCFYPPWFGGPRTAFLRRSLFFSSKSDTRLENGHLLCSKWRGHLAGGTLLASVAPCDRGAHAWHTGTNSIPPAADHLQPQLGSVAKRRACSWWSRGCLPGPGACCARWHLWHRAPVPAVQGWVAACMARVCQASAAAFWPAEMESEFKCFASGLGLFPSL